MKKKIILAVFLVAVFGILAVLIFKLPSKPKYSQGDTEISERIENIRIQCDSGSFNVLSTDKAKIGVKENSSLAKKNPKSTLKWAVTGKTLRILCEGSKDSSYILTVPNSILLDDCDVEGQNVNAEISDITARDITVRSDEGNVTVQRCKCVDAFVGEFSSGNVGIYNTFARRFNINSDSSDVRLVSPSFQRKCNITTDSGDIEIIAPSDSKYLINEHHGKGSFKSDFKSDKNGYRLNLKTSGGSVTVSDSGGKAQSVIDEVGAVLPEISTKAPVPTVKVPPTTSAAPAKTKKTENKKSDNKSDKTETESGKKSSDGLKTTVSETKKADNNSKSAAVKSAASEASASAPAAVTTKSAAKSGS